MYNQWENDKWTLIAFLYSVIQMKDSTMKS